MPIFKKCIGCRYDYQSKGLDVQTSLEPQIIFNHLCFVRDEVVYACCGNVTYPSLYFHIWIRRKSLYYVVNIIAPCVVLSSLATFTFCIAPDSGEKISLATTLLLSITVFQLIVADSVPRRSDSVPAISEFII